MHAIVEPTRLWKARHPAATPSLPVLPGSITRTMLTFEFLALVEYWLAPLLFGVTNYAGVWSWLGYGLFALLAGTLVAGVLVPLRLHLLASFRARGRRWQFHALWASGLVATLLATGSLQLVGGSVGMTGVQPTTIYTPFGAWPGVTFEAAGLHLTGTMNVAIVALLGLLSVLWASAVILRLGRRVVDGPLPLTARARWTSRAAAVLFWAPIGFMTGCSSCTPLYVAGLSVVAPGVALEGYNAIPLVPWIGLSGLLALASLGFTLFLLKDATTPPGASRPVRVAGAA